MMTLLLGIVLLGAIITALYAFGIFSTPYTDAFRIGFYLLLVVSFVAVVLAMGRNPFEGYDPTPSTP
jgi:Na+/proline symporter